MWRLIRQGGWFPVALSYPDPKSGNPDCEVPKVHPWSGLFSG
jgi:hypothetical protein